MNRDGAWTDVGEEALRPLTTERPERAVADRDATSESLRASRDRYCALALLDEAARTTEDAAEHRVALGGQCERVARAGNVAVDVQCRKLRHAPGLRRAERDRCRQCE